MLISQSMKARENHLLYLQLQSISNAKRNRYNYEIQLYGADNNILRPHTLWSFFRTPKNLAIQGMFQLVHSVQNCTKMKSWKLTKLIFIPLEAMKTTRLVRQGSRKWVVNENMTDLLDVQFFYRAMHFSAFARSWDCMSSVCLSVCL